MAKIIRKEEFRDLLLGWFVVSNMFYLESGEIVTVSQQTFSAYEVGDDYVEISSGPALSDLVLWLVLIGLFLVFFCIVVFLW